MAYVTKTEVKQYGGITWTSGNDSFVDTLIAAAQNFIEQYCGDKRFGKRVFEAPDSDSDVTRYFDGNDRERLQIGDLRSITSLTVDGTALTENTDYYLRPYNITEGEEPYTVIELVQPETSFSNQNPRSGNAIPYVFERLQRSVVVVGKFRYSDSAPSAVKVAMMKIIVGFIKENIGDNDLREVTQETLGEYSVSYAKLKDVADRVGATPMLETFKRGKVTGASKVVRVS